MKNFSKILCCILTFLFLISISPMAASAKAATVSAEAIAASEESIIVPVTISSSDDNLMGFKITVAHSEQVKIKAVTRGSVTAKGNFNTNFGVNDGRFDIIWNNTAPVEAKGTLFALTVDTSQVTEDTEIRLTFSRPDTFDGEYNDVMLVMENIKISVLNSEATDEPSTEAKAEEIESSQEETNASGLDFDGSQLADSVNNSLSSEDKDTIYDVLPDEQDDFVENVNNNMQIILGSGGSFYNDFGEMLEAYENYYTGSFTSDIIINLDSADIQNIIDEALNEFNAKALENVKEKDREEFVKLVEEKVQGKLPDRYPVSDKVKTEIVYNAIEDLYNVSSKTNEAFYDSAFVEDQPPSTNAVIVALSGVAIVAVLTTIVFKIKWKKAKNK